MKTYIYTFYDKKIEGYTQPILEFKNSEDFADEIVRNLKRCDDLAYLKKYQDYQLFLIGSYDDKTGVVTRLDNVCVFDCADICTKLIGRIEGGKSDA